MSCSGFVEALLAWECSAAKHGLDPVLISSQMNIVFITHIHSHPWVPVHAQVTLGTVHNGIYRKRFERDLTTASQAFCLAQQMDSCVREPSTIKHTLMWHFCCLYVLSLETVVWINISGNASLNVLETDIRWNINPFIRIGVKNCTVAYVGFVWKYAYPHDLHRTWSHRGFGDMRRWNFADVRIFGGWRQSSGMFALYQTRSTIWHFQSETKSVQCIKCPLTVSCLDA